MIMDRDREHLLGLVLTDDIVVEDLADLLRGRNLVARFRQRRLVLLADDVHAQFDALVADEDGRPGNELAHLVLALAAERAVERVLRIAAAEFAHLTILTRCESSLSLCRRPKPGGRTVPLLERPADSANLMIHRTKYLPRQIRFVAAIGTPMALFYRVDSRPPNSGWSGNKRLAFMVLAN